MKNHTILLLFLAAFGFGATAQSINASIQKIHGAGCDNQSGKLKVNPYPVNGTYTYLWSNGSTEQIIDSLPAGDYSVIVYSGSDSVVRNYTLHPFGIGSVDFHHACLWEPGYITLNDVEAQSPVHYTWYRDSTLLPYDFYSIDELSAGTYHYGMTDNEGCTDSGSVTLIESVQHMDVFLEDSSLCYWETTLVWYSPGFTVYYMGELYNTTTDTLLYTNVSTNENIPYYGIDSLGCETESIWPPPFIYRQAYPYTYPQPVLYQIGDTLSTSPTIQLEPSACCTVNWYRSSELVASWPYYYLPVDTAGHYSVSFINEYDCYQPGGSIDVAFAGLEESGHGSIGIYPNPVTAGESWQIEWAGAMEGLPYTIADHSGKIIATGHTNGVTTILRAPETAGVYFLQIGGAAAKLVVTD